MTPRSSRAGIQRRKVVRAVRARATWLFRCATGGAAYSAIRGVNFRASGSDSGSRNVSGTTVDQRLHGAPRAFASRAWDRN